MRRPLALLALSGLLASPAGAQAQEWSFWEDVIDPRCGEARRIKRDLSDLLSTRLERADSSLLVLAVSRAGRAVTACPDDPELRVIRARLLYDINRWDEAVTELERAIELRPESSMAAEASFVLGVTLTRLDRFDQAAEAYRRFLREAIWPERRAMALTNLAETRMARDELQEALGLLREAVATDAGYTLAYFGLAVVLDRLGEQGQALAEMMRGLSQGEGFELLNNPDVFYVPEWEIHYYRALAHEALGQSALALTQWHLFLDLGGDHGPYAARALAHISDLER